VTPTRWALVTFGLLLVLLVTLIVLTTPWRPLPGTPPGGRVAVAAARDFTPDEMAREAAYHRAVRLPAYTGLVLGLVVAGVLGLTPLGARLVTWAARPLGGGWWARLVAGVVALLAISEVVSVPFDAWAETARRRYGLSTQNWGSWTVDTVKGLGLGIVFTLIGLLVLYAVARAAPRSWWAWAALGAAALTVLASFVYPLLVEPVFNKFTSLPAGELRTSLLDLARRDGVPVRDVLVADASRRTTTLNAYVSGFGSTRRIVVFDTLLTSASPDEVRLVVAHELGHVKRNDVLHGTAIGALGAAVAVTGLFALLTSGGVLRRIGADSASDPRSMAFVVFALTAVATVAGPVESLLSRRVETRADVHALDLTRDPDTFVLGERTLALAGLSDLHPNPIVYGLFFTHPSSPERIALARTWARLHGVPEPGDLVPAGRP
jgi:STE24 endopeptidase